MDLARFEAIVAAYGADPRRWPQGERAAAEAFASAQAAAVAPIIAEARALDAAIDADGPVSAPSDLLAARILAEAPKPSSLARGELRVAAALAACALLGLAIGFAGSSAIAPADAPDAIVAAAFDAAAVDLALSGDEG